MERCVGTCVCLLVIMTGVHGEVRWDVCVFTGNNDWCAVLCVLLLPFPLPLPSFPSSLLPRLELLQVLTEGGRAVDYIESGIGPLMVQWMPGVMEGWRWGSTNQFARR